MMDITCHTNVLIVLQHTARGIYREIAKKRKQISRLVYVSRRLIPSYLSFIAPLGTKLCYIYMEILNPTIFGGIDF